MDTGVPSTSSDAVATEFIITRMLLGAKQASDLFLSPGCQPSVKINGALVAIEVPGIETLVQKIRRGLPET